MLLEMRMKRVCIVLLLAAFARAEPGYFYALDAPDKDDRLYRIDVDEDWLATLTPIGPPGALNYPQVEGVVWDRIQQRLYGYDSFWDEWLEINTETGRAVWIGPFMLEPSDMTYSVNRGKVYAKSGHHVYSVDPETAETDQVASAYFERVLAYAIDTPYGATGLFICGTSLSFLVDPGFDEIEVGPKTTAILQGLMWDHRTDTLFGAYSSGWLARINQITGVPTLIAALDVSIEIRAITFVPGDDGLPPICSSFDADNDGDVDLIDFGAFQWCYSIDPAYLPYHPVCAAVDPNGDGRIELSEFIDFQWCVTNPQ